MNPTGPVHFIHLGGQWAWQHWRAVETARRVQGFDTETIVWSVDENLDYGFSPHHVELRPLEVPDWLISHPIRLANVKDLYAWRILHEHGGLYLDLDTISLKPVWDLATRDVLVSTEWPNPEDGRHQYNSAVVVGKRGAPVLAGLAQAALEILESGEARWGKTGPHLLTRFVEAYPEAFAAAPFGVLNGWRDGTIGDYYDGERPGPDVRIIHLYSSSRPERFLADRWRPFEEGIAVCTG